MNIYIYIYIQCYSLVTVFLRHWRLPQGEETKLEDNLGS